MNSEEQRLAERVVTAMFARDAFSRSLGMEVVDVRPRGSTVRLTVRDDMVNGFGACHGGVTFSLADSAVAFACNTHGHVTVAIENGIRYPRSIVVGDVLTATADEESSTNKLGFYRVTVLRANNDIVATFTGTVFRTHQPHFTDNE
jgi:acyl-CoA thioesterase